MLTAFTVVLAVVLFLGVILLHEFGHFIFAKKFGVKVNEFAVGMGPKLFSKKRGETTYSLRAIPIGGFCSMEGEDEASDDDRAFNRKKVWQRVIIVSAGAIFNIILGLIFMLIIQAQEPYYVSRTVAAFQPSLSSREEYLAEKDDTVFYYTDDNGVTLRKIVENTSGVMEDNVIAYSEVKDSGYIFREAISGKTGLKVDDQIYSVNGYRALCFYDAYFAMCLDEDGVMDFVVIRNGEKLELKNVTFSRAAGTGSLEGTETTVLDFQVYGVPRTFKTAVQSALLQSQYCLRSVYVSLYRLVTGQAGMNELSGPVGIASMIGDVAKEGFAESFMDGVNNILYFMAIITFNLGIVNLLPLPALDGGRLVFLLVEGIRRKPLPVKYEGVVNFIGLMLLLALMAVITFNDVLKLISSCG